MDYKKALEKAAALCAQKERCLSDIRKKLQNWELSDSEIEDALSYLVKEKYIDESRFAQYYVRDKFRFNQWGKIKISYMLNGMEVDKKNIQNALNEINELDYQECLTALLKTKHKKLKNKDFWQTKAALIRFAQSRGFETDLTYKVIETLLEEQ